MFLRLLPLLSGGIWIGTILGLVITWLIQGRPHLASFDAGQTIPFISDLGAFQLKPLFIAGSLFTILFYLATLIADRVLRHRRSPGQSTCGEILLSIIVFVTAAIGGAALVLLSIFDNFHFKSTHDKLVAVFLIGNLISAGALVMEYLLVARRHQMSASKERLARSSFHMKLVYFMLELVAAIAFIAIQALKGNINVAAILEYVNAFLFAWFIFSFFMDLRRTPRARGYREMPKEHLYGPPPPMHMGHMWDGRRYDHPGVYYGAWPE